MLYSRAKLARLYLCEVLAINDCCFCYFPCKVYHPSLYLPMGKIFISQSTRDDEVFAGNCLKIFGINFFKLPVHLKVFDFHLKNVLHHMYPSEEIF